MNHCQHTVTEQDDTEWHCRGPMVDRKGADLHVDSRDMSQLMFYEDRKVPSNTWANSLGLTLRWSLLWSHRCNKDKCTHTIKAVDIDKLHPDNRDVWHLSKGCVHSWTGRKYLPLVFEEMSAVLSVFGLWEQVEVPKRIHTHAHESHWNVLFLHFNKDVLNILSVLRWILNCIIRNAHLV